MATKPKKALAPKKAARTKRPSQRDAIFAMADFIKALGPQESQAEALRVRALARCRDIGWKG